jgi:hypothetical protein
MRRRMAPRGSPLWAAGWPWGVPWVLGARQDVWGPAWLLGAAGWRPGDRGAGQVEEAVVAVLHVLEHGQEGLFPGPCDPFPLQGGLFPGLGVAELLFQEGDHVKVDVQRV